MATLIESRDSSQDPTPCAPRELEIKLVGPHDVLARAMRSPVFKQRTRGKVITRMLHSVYFDTPDGALQRQGVGLRLRKQGRKWIQTIKRERSVSAGLHDRDELEHEVSLRWPSFTLLDGSVFQDTFKDLELRKLIQPVFTTEFRRSQRMFKASDGALIEIAFDRGQILANGSVPICEIELELKHGDAASLFALASELCTQFPIRLENRSKAERGYALLNAEAAQPTRARAIILDPGMTPSEAFVAIASECLRHLQANEEGMLHADDPEYIHQARVALRRLRAAISLFRTAIPKASLEQQNGALRKLGQTLGVARDWDVFSLETLPALPSDLTNEAGIGALIAESDAKRKVADECARRYISDASYTLALLDIAATFYRQPWMAVEDSAAVEARALPLVEFARKVLSKSWRSAAKRAESIDLKQPVSLHPLRIELKKLRYGGEFFSSLFARKTTRQFLKLLSEIQDHLGHINDATTVVRMADALRQDCREPDTREALGALRGYFAAQVGAEIAPAMKAWKRLKQTDTFWP